MHGTERRRTPPAPCRELERNLNTAQLLTLRELEHFGWELKFVRRPTFQPVIPIVFDGDRKNFAVIESDGSLNEHPSITIRH